VLGRVVFVSGICAIAIAPAAALGLDPSPTSISVTAAVTGESILVSGAVLPAQPGGPVTVTVVRSKRKGAPYRRVRSAEATINLEGTFSTRVNRKRKGNCRLTAAWAGDADSLPSSATTGFRC
jgi:hypothetical protein